MLQKSPVQEIQLHELFTETRWWSILHNWPYAWFTWGFVSSAASACVLLGIYGFRRVLAPKEGSQGRCFQQLTRNRN